MEDFKLYTINELTTILKVTQRTVYNYIKSKNLKALKIGKYWRVRHTDLREFLVRGSNIKELL
jgi:excisionase family DNA binding protein